MDIKKLSNYIFDKIIGAGIIFMSMFFIFAEIVVIWYGTKRLIFNFTFSIELVIILLLLGFIFFLFLRHIFRALSIFGIPKLNWNEIVNVSWYILTGEEHLYDDDKNVSY